MLEIMKIVDEKEREKRQEGRKGNVSYNESAWAKLFCCAFKWGFLKVMCKASLFLNQI